VLTPPDAKSKLLAALLVKTFPKIVIVAEFASRMSPNVDLKKHVAIAKLEGELHFQIHTK